MVLLSFSITSHHKYHMALYLVRWGFCLHQLHINIDHHILRDQHICKLCDMEPKFELFAPSIMRIVVDTIYLEVLILWNNWVSYENHKCITLYIEEAFHLIKRLITSRSRCTTRSKLITSVFQLEKIIKWKCIMIPDDCERVTHHHVTTKPTRVIPSNCNNMSLILYWNV